MPEVIRLFEALIRDAVPQLINATVIPHQSVLGAKASVCLHESSLSRIYTLQLEVTLLDYWPVGMLL